MSRLTFPASLPGLEPLVEFDLADVKGAVGLYSLNSVELPEVKLFALDPAVHLPEYTPTLSAGHMEQIGATAPEQVRVLTVVNGTGSPTANLLAPLVINAQNGAGAQVILEGQDWPVRAELTMHHESQN